MKKLLLLLSLLISGVVNAATINVGPGQTIASGIAAASTGDTVLVAASTRNESIVLNKSVTVKANGLVTLRPGSSRAIDVQANNATVDGFTFENFSQAASGGNNSSRTGVTIKNCKFTNTGAGIWIWGTNWTLDTIILHCRMRGGEDYMNAFGSGHTIRRVFCYGVLPSDLLQSDGSYKHNDCVQTWTAGGAPGLKNSTIEQCIFTDFAQGTYIHNEDGVSGAVTGMTIQNNVFWGVDFPRAGGTLPSHGTRLTGPGSTGNVIKNNLYKYISNNLRLTSITALVDGNIVMDGGAGWSVGSSTINRGSLGNLFWGNQNMGSGGPSGAPDKTNINPQLRNPSARGLELMGPDGLWFSGDEPWLPLNTVAKDHGPQVSGAVIPNQNPVAANDAYPAIYGNTQFAEFNVLSNDSDPNGDVLSITGVSQGNKQGTVQNTTTRVQYRPKAGVSGVETFTYSISDGKGGTAVGTVTITIPPDINPPNLTLNGDSQIFLDVGQPYVELGAVAVDDKDGTVEVIITGIVGDTAGNYSIMYVARDLAGNLTSKERVVTRTAPNCEEEIAALEEQLAISAGENLVLKGENTALKAQLDALQIKYNALSAWAQNPPL